MVPPDSDHVSRVWSYSGTLTGVHSLSPTGRLPSVVCGSTQLRLANGFVTPAEPATARKKRPTTPDMQRVAPCTCPVWADPFSLATTQGVSVDFLSSGYLDVSVPPLTCHMAMCSPWADAALPAPGLPIRKSTDQRLFNTSPWLIAVVHVLHRLLVPRHPPCALDILTVI